MIKKDLVLYGVVGALIVAGAYIIGVDYQQEKLMQITEAQQVADNWKHLPNDQTTCEEINSKRIGLGLEEFAGVEIIQQALDEKWVKMNCDGGLD